MSGFVLHPEAHADLKEIREYTASDNLDAADRTLEEIYEAIQALAAFPCTGHHRPDLTARPLRFQSLRDYVIAYAPDEQPLVVIASSPCCMAVAIRESDRSHTSRRTLNATEW